MLGELISMILFAVPCAVLGLMFALALRRWAAHRSVMVRTILASVASIVPLVGLIVFAADGSLGILLSLSLDEFLIPFAIQVGLVFALTAPGAWLVSKRQKSPSLTSQVFD